MATVTPDAQGNVPQASLELFRSLLAARGGDTHTRLVEAAWLSNFIVHHWMVPQYRKGRAFVAGDAAHIHSPAGGQGMNTGIQDAYNLGWKLALVVKGTAPEALLDTYEAERLPVARHVLEETDTNQKLGISRGPVAEFILNHMVAPLLSVPTVGEHFLEDILVKRGSQLDVNYRTSRLAGQNDHFTAGPEAGDRAPDGHLLDRSGQATSLFAQFRTPDFRLLLFQGRAPAADVPELADIGTRIQAASGGLVRPFLILDPHDTMSSRMDGLILLRDPARETHNTYGASSACLYLVRPDGYVGFRSRLAGESKLTDYLGRNFVSQLAGR
jgi:hypothetical protein